MHLRLHCLELLNRPTLQAAHEQECIKALLGEAVHCRVARAIATLRQLFQPICMCHHRTRAQGAGWLVAEDAGRKLAQQPA